MILPKREKGRKMCKLMRGLSKVILLFVWFLVAVGAGWTETRKMAPESGPDLELKEFRLDELEARLRTMPPGVERDYFAGEVANRLNHIEESIELLNKVLLAIREVRPDRAKEALETLADDYMTIFRYADA